MISIIRIEDPARSLLEVLRDRGYFLPAWCGGRGSCGKCKVRILSFPAGKRGEDLSLIRPVTDSEAACLSDKEISDGWRLACAVYGEGIYEVEVPDYEEEEIRAAVYSDGRATASLSKESLPDREVLAVDIGTTTIEAALADRVSGKVLRTATGINHQSVYGADVLSRIEASNQGHGEHLQNLIMKDLDELCGKLGLGGRVKNLSIPVIISGNTTMQHLLQGLSCQTLGTYPFDPVDISLHTFHNMTLLPGISTYVGADIVSGIIACGMDQKEEVSVLVDLGTNGEMVIGNRDRILVASAAAGPAFEGGNISCGMPGVPGAIDTVEIRNRTADITTIDGRKPAGICGSGVLETVYELRKEGLVDETGLLHEDYFDRGFPLAEGVIFTAKDIREVQLAKAAIRAGIEILMASYGVSGEQIDRLFLAGGFGLKLNEKKTVGIGMLPKELADRIRPVANSSLKGAVLFAWKPEMAGRFRHVVDISKEISLPNHKDFNGLYVDYMGFPDLSL